MLSLITAVPEIGAAAALSAGSLGAFAPPPGVARLVIARDNDEDGALAAERLARRCAPGWRLCSATREREESGVSGKPVTQEEGGHGRRRQSS